MGMDKMSMPEKMAKMQKGMDEAGELELTDKFEAEPRSEKECNKEKKREKNREEREGEIEKARKEIDDVADGLEYAIDEKIKNVTVALNVMGLPTEQSCQGHYGEEGEGHGMGAPWVSISAPNEPRFRFNKEEEIIEKVARKYGATFEDVERCIVVEAYNEAINEASDYGESGEYKEWDKKNIELQKKVRSLLDEFYNNRKEPKEARIEVEEGVGYARLYSGEKDFIPISELKNSEQEKEEHEQRLEDYQKEMDEFGDFLLDKYLNE